jgi:glycosyltransferase involved in cell wall biosynthesis
MKILAIIPCYNEAASLPALLEQMVRHCPELDLLVIDDASTDNTAEVVSGKLPVIRLVRNLGIGGAVQTGLKYAQRNGYELALQIDGDGQHPPEQIPNMLAHYREVPVNILIGSRFLEEGGFNSTFLRRQGIFLIRWTLNLLYGSRITDPTSGMRLMDRKAIALFSEQYPQDYPEPISIANALEQGMSVAEVSVSMRSRMSGKSTISGLWSLIYMIQVVGYILLTRAKRLFVGKS